MPAVCLGPELLTFGKQLINSVSCFLFGVKYTYMFYLLVVGSINCALHFPAFLEKDTPLCIE
jgi:hypothetical protein